jgi:O-acetylserine/cysteine efflux transporter
VIAPRDVALAVVVAVLWGLAFVATRIGLDELTPSQLAAARFLLAAAPAVVIARPRVSWRALVAVGLTLFAGQFLFQFFGIAAGTPPGLASIIVQTQALFTIGLAALLLRERPTARETAGIALGLAGLGVIALTVGGDLSPVGLALTLVSPLSFAVGNLLLMRLPVSPTMSLVVWLSVVPPLPALALSVALDGPSGIARSIATVSWRGIGAVIYLGAVATVVAYAIWGDLLRRYPVAAVAPFALLVPFVAAGASALVFGERFGALRLAGMALVLCGLAVIVLPGQRRLGDP